jgi:L-lactate utilization protein LutB
MGKKKRLSKIAEAVESILGDPIKAKKLKKRKALEAFIQKMESKHREITDELERDELSDETRKLKTRHLGTLDEQLKKAKRLLDD